MTPIPPKSLVPRFFALIPCAGQGMRAIGDNAAQGAAAALPKQYQPIAGLPMVQHTLQAFAGVARIDSCLVVVAPGDDFFSGQSAGAYEVAPCGGATRAASVLNGLEQLAASGAELDDWVLVHDAARCLVTPALIDRLIDACHCDPVGGLLAQPVPDTLKQGRDERVVATVDRSDKWLAQTPQMFRYRLLTNALESFDGVPTDEAQAIEALGFEPKLVTGSLRNMKVTYPQDMALMELFIQKEIV